MGLLSLGGCTEETPQKHTTETVVMCEDYSLYRLALDSLSRGTEGRPLIAISETIRGLAIMRGDPTVPDAIRAEFTASSDVPCVLHLDSLRLAIPITLLSPDSLSAVGARDGQDVVQLSRVAYSRDSSLAVVFVDHRCGGLCGTGLTIHFRRDPAHGWRITTVHTRSIA